MSRCRACNVILNEAELTKKDKMTGDFIDLCSKCLHHTDDDDTLGFYIEESDAVKAWEDWD